MLELLLATVSDIVINDKHLYVGLLLDASQLNINQHVTLEPQMRIRIEVITRDFMYTLHIFRTVLVKAAES